MLRIIMYLEIRKGDTKDANDPQSKDYMWVYHSPGIQDSKKIYLYEYDNGSRSAAVIDRYLEGYKGILVSDGYASYHTLGRKYDDLKVAGCRVHCKQMMFQRRN